MRYNFEKLHGLGNDFVFIEDKSASIEFSTDQIAWICDRHFGIGADGVILVRPSSHENCVGYMHYINSDGSLAEMCGNGIRCFAKYLVDHGYADLSSNCLIADTLRGPLSLTFEVDENRLLRFATVDMDEPILTPQAIPVDAPDSALSIDKTFVENLKLESPWGTFLFACVSMGNPHAVCFIDDFNSLPDELFCSKKKTLNTFLVSVVGAYFESHQVFPAKANIEFVSVEKDGLHMRVFERGCGETLACGTGACATLVAACLTKRSSRENAVKLRGGTLSIVWDENNHVFMTGPAEKSFDGVFQLDA